MKFYEINGKRNLCGDRIREARQKRRLSQSDLCKLLQLRGIMVERDVISRMESGSRIVTDFEAGDFGDLGGLRALGRGAKE